MKLVYQNTISRLYEKIIGNLSNVHTQDLNDFIYSAQMKGLHQFHIILQSTYMKFSYTRHIPSYTLQQCTLLLPARKQEMQAKALITSERSYFADLFALFLK